MIKKFRKGEKIIQQKKQTEKTEPEIKEIKEQILRKIH